MQAEVCLVKVPKCSPVEGDLRVVGFGYLESLELWLVLKWHLQLEIHLNKNKNRGKLYCLEEAKNMEWGRNSY